jgi:hypothetical protein
MANIRLQEANNNKKELAKYNVSCILVLPLVCFCVLQRCGFGAESRRGKITHKNRKRRRDVMI